MSRFAHNPEDSEGAQPEETLHDCAHPGCAEAGIYRAPRSPEDLSSYYWFCLEHVRVYNARWDFFSGMSEDEIDAFRHDDVTGHRPTWPIGVRGRLRRFWEGDGLRDLFGLFGTTEDGDDEVSAAPPKTLPVCERDALAVMNLGYAATLGDIKNRFKELVKRHHPDVNHGDKAAEERLKSVIEAYRLLKRRRSA